MDHRLRRAGDRDEPALHRMLYYAALLDQDGAPPSAVADTPEIARYVKGWGRPGDTGYIAIGSGHDDVLGAAWVRRFPADDPGYGFVDERTPELSVALRPDARGRGIGTDLLTALIADLRDRPDVAGVSLSVRATNPAVRLYERLGFQRLGRADEASVTMLLFFGKAGVTRPNEGGNPGGLAQGCEQVPHQLPRA